MASQIVKEFSPKELEILWSCFKLPNHKTSKLVNNVVTTVDLGMESEIQKLMMINHNTLAAVDKRNK